MKKVRLKDYEERLQKLRDLAEIAKQRGNYDHNRYLHGYANGVILAIAVMEHQHQDVPFLSVKKGEYTEDAQKLAKSWWQRFKDWMNRPSESMGEVL